MINKLRIRDNFIKLVSIDAPSFKEAAMATEIEKQLLDLGFQVTIDNGNATYQSETGNIYGFLKGDLPGEPMLFSAHLDTVEPSANKRAICHLDGKITSAGDSVLGADDVSGMVEILEAVETLIESGNSHRDIEVLFTFAEEAFLKGSAVADYSMIKSTEAYILDLEGEIGTFATKAPSVMAFSVVIKGKAAHAGFHPEEGIHAIKTMAEFITNIEMGIIEPDTRVNIGIIKGGLGKNIIPGECSVEGEIRSMVHEKARKQLHIIEQQIQESCNKYGATYTLSNDLPSTAYNTEETEKAVCHFIDACKIKNIEPVNISTFGGSDNNNFAGHNIKGIVIACGMHQVHSTQEYTYLNELEEVAELVFLLMTSQA